MPKKKDVLDENINMSCKEKELVEVIIQQFYEVKWNKDTEIMAKDFITNLRNEGFVIRKIVSIRSRKDNLPPW